MKVLQPSNPLIYEFDRHAAPLATIESGSRIVVETEDAFSHQIAVQGDRRDLDVLPHGNPLTGRIDVEDAAPGDSIVVEIHSIEPTAGGAATYAFPLPEVLEYLGWDLKAQDRFCEIDESGIHWDSGLILPYKPMIGTIGTLPAIGQPTSGICGDWGGNMDLAIIGPGATLELPVYQPGAGLYVGDCHALQGDAEWSGAAMEMRARIEMTLSLREGYRLPGPRVRTAEELWAVGTGRSLESAIIQAYSRLALWVESTTGRSRWDTYCLLTQVGQLTVGYHGLGVVAAGVERRYLASSGIPSEGVPERG